MDGEQRWHAIGAGEQAVLLVVHVYREKGKMATKKSSASSPRGRQTSVSAESIFSKRPNKKQKAVLTRVAKRQSEGDDRGIDYSDIPTLTDEQLAGFRRSRKVLIAARLDRDVVDWLKKYGEGYSTRINLILRQAMAKAR